MKATIEITSNYGFDHNWTLVLESKGNIKSFHLGQDTKVCSRLIQMDARDVIESIGTREIDYGTNGNKRLAKLILSKLKENHLLTTRKIMGMDSWALCVQ
jgi:hypothetical protein